MKKYYRITSKDKVVHTRVPSLCQDLVEISDWLNCPRTKSVRIKINRRQLEHPKGKPVYFSSEEVFSLTEKIKEYQRERANRLKGVGK